MCYACLQILIYTLRIKKQSAPGSALFFICTSSVKYRVRMKNKQSVKYVKTIFFVILHSVYETAVKMVFPAGESLQ